MDTLNIAAYKFVALNDLPALQWAVLQQAQAHALKGTVLLAEEGINLCLAGGAADIGAFLAWLNTRHLGWLRGMALLLLGYAGSRFVLELILKRA